MTLRPYQEEAAVWLSRIKRGMIIAPAGSGKTVIMAEALSLAIGAKEREQPLAVLWIANTREQIAQGAQAILSTWNGQPEMVLAGSSVTVRTKAGHRCDLRCAAGVLPMETSYYDALIIDECHHLRSASSWRAIAEAYVERGGRAVWGCTATPWGSSDEENYWLRHFFQSRIHEVKRSDVGAILAPLEIEWVRFVPRSGIAKEIDEAIRDGMVRRRFSRMSRDQIYAQVAWSALRMIGIEQHNQRAEALVEKMELHDGESILALVQTKKLGEQIARRTGGTFVASATRGRDAILAKFRAGNIKTLIATSLADEGFDAPRAAILVNFSGGRNVARTEQRAGRIMRKHEDKDYGKVYDAWDDWHPLALKHTKERAKVYQSLQ